MSTNNSKAEYLDSTIKYFSSLISNPRYDGHIESCYVEDVVKLLTELKTLRAEAKAMTSSTCPKDNSACFNSRF